MSHLAKRLAMGVIFLLCASVQAPDVLAENGDPSIQLRGKILTDYLAFPNRWDSNKEMKDYLQDHDRQEFDADQNGTWQVHFLSFFKEIGARRCEVVFYDITDPAKKEFVVNFPHEVNPTQTSLSSSITLEPSHFRKGHRYMMKVTRLVKGREQVYATAEIALK